MLVNHKQSLMSSLQFNNFLAEQKKIGSFVGIRYDESTKDAILAKAKSLGVHKITPREKIHTTVIFSRDKVDDITIGDKIDIKMNRLMNPDIFVTQEGTNALVWKLTSSDLIARNEEYVSIGATSDYDEYKPHITISYDVGEITDEMLKPFKLDVEPKVIEEYYETLDLDWKSSL